MRMTNRKLNSLSGHIPTVIAVLLCLSVFLGALSYTILMSIRSSSTRLDNSSSLTALACNLERNAPETNPAVANEPRIAQKLPTASLQRISNGTDLVNYDEQLGLTFTQNSSSLACNVTAVVQTYYQGEGPAYLLNGLSDQGYWYQVGLSWNWPYLDGSGYNPGFNALFEVFAPNGTSIFPSGRGSLLKGISVNQNDTVSLELFFSNSNVTMWADDLNTGSTVQESYPAHGATHFVGLQNNTGNSEGFFTGLMTEQYHATSYQGDMQTVVYSGSAFKMSSAWMWIDEYQPPNRTEPLFSDDIQISYSNPTLLQRFSSHAANEFSDANQFMTGNANNSIVALTLKVSARGSVSCAFGPTQEILSRGTTETVYLPSGVNVTLVATPSSFLYVFSGWSGASTSNENSISFAVDSSIALQANFNYDDVNVVSLGLLICLVLVIIVCIVVVILPLSRALNKRR